MTIHMTLEMEIRTGVVVCKGPHIGCQDVTNLGYVAS
jgi:hypothetical protein